MQATQSPSDPQDFDVIVLGSGPGGEGAAMRATKAGKRVAMVEKHREVGGACTHSATIPSKALRQAVRSLQEFRHNPLFAGALEGREISFPMLLRSATAVIHNQVEMRRGFYERNHVRVFHGHARFVDPHTVEVEAASGARPRLRAAGFVLATGSRPYRPPDVDFGHPRVFDSDTILGLDHTPNTVTIYGAGVVGCEYASIFRGLDVKVNLINNRDKLLAFLDDEIIDALSYHLRDQGVVIRHNETYERIEAQADGVVVQLKSGKKIKSDILLWANGRTGNTHELGLDQLGITANGRGQIDVDEFYRSRVAPHVYAVGDVVGYPSLASAAYDQGRFAAEHLITGQCDTRLIKDIPTGIYTNPEVSSIGRTESELTKEGVPYEVGHALFRSLARAQLTGYRVGMLKLLFHRESLQLLGIHCFGDQAAEIVHIGQAIMAQQGEANSLRYFINTTFNYPTMAEAYRVAALNGLNRLF
ncbi:Si-specific NAD(P)(+) transhydrogenase [Nannocystis sp.]|uniref:Si-specific NAD(P)(+) transhydrogenase n=1 Tax=Nannocystis sp. TaxID=1962667 RepID=UPI0025EA44E6|nr:Si-specific NAD(P)(+) transhydrogenase [Nannocystis sp.]MBK7825881.1 Si-specific NAD(P)(+) transhydrogenase [Nannocystis sp.]